VIPVTVKYGMGVTLWVLLIAYFAYVGRARRAT